MALVLGCANSQSPVAPDGKDTGGTTGPQKTAQIPGKALWGIFEVTLDPIAETATIVLLRTAAFKANVTQFLQPPLGKPNYVSFGNLDFSDFSSEGIVRLQVGVTHPFPGLNQYRGFDVLGVFMSDASFASQSEPGAILPRQDGSEARLLNADGYTRWFNPGEFPAKTIFGFVPGIYGSPGFTPDATVNGYKYFCDGLAADEDLVTFFTDPGNLANRGSFTPGTVNKRDYEIQFPNRLSPLKYQYAILASWEQPSNPHNPTLDDFSLAANQGEPFLLMADTSASTVYYESPDNNGGTLHIELTVYDWQALAGEGGGIPVDQQIDGWWIESFFDVFLSPQDVLPGATVAVDGPASSTFTVDIADVNPTHAGDEWLILAVESADPSSYDQGFGAPASDGRLAAYLVTKVTVSPENPMNQAPSVGNITGETNPWEIDSEEYTITALDPEGDQLHYEWSLVVDGAAIVWGNVGSDTDAVTIDWSDYGPGDYDLHCRVKDDFNAWQLAANDPLDIAVKELSITCGNGVFGYNDYAYTQCQQVESVFLSDGTAISEYGYSSMSREFEVMKVYYGWHQPGYCGQTNYEDPCDDTWCELYSDLYFPSTDPTNRTIHMDCDMAGTYGSGQETNDVVAFVMLQQPNILRFLHGFNTSSHSAATEYPSKTLPSGTVTAMDFDEAGDLWVLSSNGNTYELTKSSTYDMGSLKFTVDMSELAPTGTKVFDWAISYLNGDFYVFTDETTGGTLHRVSGTNGAIVDTVHNALDAGISNPDYGLGTTGARADVEIDHRIMTGENPLAENCRLVIGGGPGGTGKAVMFARYDQALNLLSTWDNNQLGGGTCYNYASTSGGRFIIFDPVEHEDNPATIVDEEECRHTMWVGDAGTGAGNLIWADSCRPIPDDWDGN